MGPAPESRLFVKKWQVNVFENIINRVRENVAIRVDFGNRVFEGGLG